MELNSIQQIRLQNLNKGFNFGNLQQTEKKHFVRVMLKIKQDLKEKEEELEVETNLFGYWGYREKEVTDFLVELEKFAKKPLLIIKKFNRKNDVSNYELGNLEDNFRKNTIDFEDIEFQIGELANLKLRDLNIDFIEQVKNILALQIKADEETQKLVDRFVYLKEQTLTLKECLGIKKESYSYSREKEDETMKMVLLSAEQYNERLKIIEKEMKAIAKKLNITIRDYDFKYIAIPKKVSLKEWLKVNEEALQESWDSFDEEEQAEEGDFNKFAEKMYDENNGEIIEEAEDEDSEE